ncbi:MAG: hypothetical protein RIM84_24235 [Alphaproteobacteria bacterium]
MAAAPGDEHWSKQFPAPAKTTAMTPATGMADGVGKPRLRQVKWHDGKLWMSGAWGPGVSATDITKQLRNELWHLWTWSPEAGYEAVVYFHTNKGGAGPDGQIYDFLWLPDGRLVVAGGFTRVDNPGGTRYHRVNALAVYDPNEPTANKWQPLGSFQYNGTVSDTGSIEAIAYDPQGNDLYIGGTFAGILNGNSEKLHRYDFDTGSYEPVPPGVHGQKARVRRIKVDTSTTPSTIYVAGRFQYTAGDGQQPRVSSSTARYSPGIAKWQAGKGWTTFPEAASEADEDTLQRAADFMHFDSVHVLDFLVDGENLWIVGAFSGGKKSGETLRGIAKWDGAAQQWVDPTGKGGVGREVWSIAKADNGKIYFGGSFGGISKPGSFFDGFKDGTPAHMAMSYDPASGAWAQLGSGLAPIVFPETRMTVNGNDVYYVGDFKFIGPENEGDAAWASNYIARWNETIDFVANPAEVQAAATPSPRPATTAPLATGNEHWSRGFPPPPRRKRPDELAHSAATGPDSGSGPPEVTGMAWLGDTLYFAGNWPALANERWFVWSYDAANGWQKLAWDARGKGEGPSVRPLGLKVHDGKVWVYGGLPKYKGLAIYDPAAKSWGPFEGTWNGNTVMGHATAGSGGGAIRDIAWDSRTGDFYMIGASGLTNPDYAYPGDVAPVIRVDKDGTYSPMGHDIKPEDPKKPVKVFQTIHIDERQDPSDIYIGGTFVFYGPAPSASARQLYNVARWDREAQDWAPIGKGAKPNYADRDDHPDGYPGLPTRPDTFGGFLRTNFPRVRALITDAEGNLYVGGTLAVIDDTLPVADRVETFGIARWDRASDTWSGPTKVGGLSRDILQMSWLDEARTRLLLSGAFEYGNDWTPLNGVAILDTATGELQALGGGLMKASRDQIDAPMVRHAVRGDELWFAGLFDHAGVNANSVAASPIPSNFVAMWNPNADFSAADKPVSGGAPPAPTADAPKLGRSVAYKVEQLESELDKAEADVAAGKSPKRRLNTMKRLWSEIGRAKDAATHPRVVEAKRRYDALQP